jgi:hypothetical protein
MCFVSSDFQYSMSVIQSQTRCSYILGKKEDVKGSFLETVPIFIFRDKLRETIIRELDLLDHVTVLAWCNHLLSHGFIEQNPTSNITPHGHRLPSNDTRYFLNIERINQFLKSHATLSLCLNSVVATTTTTKRQTRSFPQTKTQPKKPNRR